LKNQQDFYFSFWPIHSLVVSTNDAEQFLTKYGDKLIIIL